MIALSQLLHVDCIDLDLDSTSQKGVLKEMVDLLYKAKRIQKPAKIIQHLLQRERLISTAVGKGVAIPHAMIEEIRETLLVIGRSQRGVRYGAPDKQLVHLFFMLIGPTEHEYRHLQILSRLARLLHDAGFKQKLIAAITSEKIIQAFEETEKHEG